VIEEVVVLRRDRPEVGDVDAEPARCRLTEAPIVNFASLVAPATGHVRYRANLGEIPFSQCTRGITARGSARAAPGGVRLDCILNG
jgi:hypothetical protein